MPTYLRSGKRVVRLVPAIHHDGRSRGGFVVAIESLGSVATISVRLPRCRKTYEVTVDEVYVYAVTKAVETAKKAKAKERAK